MSEAGREYIGKPLEYVLGELAGKGYETETENNTGTKQKHANVRLVTAVRYEGRKVIVVYSEFLTRPLE